MFDERVTREFYKSIALAWAIAMLWGLGLQQGWIALSITLGVMLGASVLASLNWMVRSAFVPGSTRAMGALWKMMLIKYPLIGVFFYFLVRWDNINLPAFCGGFILVYVAIVCKIIGYWATERS